MKLGAGVQRVHWNGDPGLLSSCSQGGEPGTILHGFHLLIISLYFTVLFLDKFRKKRERQERVIYHGSLLFLHLRCSKDLGGFKASGRHEQGHIIPI